MKSTQLLWTLLLVINYYYRIKGDFTTNHRIMGTVIDKLDDSFRPILMPKYKTTQIKDDIKDEHFDFIIVGAGASGCVLANRLSQIPAWRILLIEAGVVPTFLTEVPALAALIYTSKYNWDYVTEPETDFALAFEGQRLSWGRGKGLGGSTLINYMMYVRGNRRDYDEYWPKGWSYRDLLPYFFKGEKSHLQIADEGYHSVGGKIDVSYVPYRSTGAKVFVKACQEAGFRRTDYNGRTQYGVSFVQGTIKDGTRMSAERAYLRPIRNRPNLHILTNATVTKLLIHKENRTVHGVQFHTNNKYYTVHCRKEVILSAGVIGSAQLLVLSGIGPVRDMIHLGIDPIVDLPVGMEIQDHVMFLGLIYVLDQPVHQIEQKIMTDKALREYLLTAKGPLTSLNNVEAVAYTKADQNSSTTRPDFEFVYMSGTVGMNSELITNSNLRLKETFYTKFFKGLNADQTLMIAPMLLHPKSVGHIRIVSRDPFKHPKLYGGYLKGAGEDDLRVLLKGVRIGQRIGGSEEWKKYGAKLLPNPIPGCGGGKYKFDSDEYWKCAIRTLTSSIHHQLGSCRMGQRSDPRTIVRNDLKVKGVQRLRVADASIIPDQISGHPYAITIVIGEKASDMIKSEWTGGGN